MDLTLYGPGDRILYQGQRKQYDSVDFDAFTDGEYYSVLAMNSLVLPTNWSTLIYLLVTRCP